MQIVKISLLLGLAAPLWAQPVSKSFDVASAQTLEIIMANTDLTVQGTTGSQLEISVSDYQAPPERAAGLRPLYGAGEDNTGMGLFMEKRGGVIVLTQARPQTSDYQIKIPQGMNLRITDTNMKASDYTIIGIKGEIEMESKTSDILIEQAEGPVVVNSMTGDITVKFDKVPSDKPSSLTNISGFLDVSVPSSASANFRLNNLSGEVYTDLQLDFSEKENRDLSKPTGLRKFEATYNGGGAQILIKNLSGDIYLRKKQ